MAAQHEPRTPARPVAGSRRKTRIGRASAQAATRGFATDSQAGARAVQASQTPSATAATWTMVQSGRSSGAAPCKATRLATLAATMAPASA